MSRWEPEHRRGRLEQAALALCGKRGFGQTTVVEIAERAGLTERTFFCHFADQREAAEVQAQPRRPLEPRPALGAATRARRLLPPGDAGVFDTGGETPLARPLRKAWDSGARMLASRPRAEATPIGRLTLRR